MTKKKQSTRLKTRSIAVVTGTRSDYGILRPVIKAIDKHQRLELKLAVTNAHWDKTFGETANEIKKDGFPITYRILLPIIRGVGESISGKKPISAYDMARSVGVGITYFAERFSNARPDIVLVLGDRFGMFAAASAAATMMIPVAHIHGGERTKGGVDESYRHAITKLAHIHFPATKKSASRILRMGEEKSRIHIVGAPALDTIRGLNLAPAKDIIEKYYNGLAGKRHAILVQHSVTSEPEKSGLQIKATLNALAASDCGVLAFYPTNDAGCDAIIEALNKPKWRKFMRVLKSLPHEEYLSLLSAVDFIIGNSSGGIIEAASFRTPVINLGIRQNGREKAQNVVDCEFKTGKIKQAIRYVLTNKTFRRRLSRIKNPYGDGRAASRIVKVLANLRLDHKLIQKQIQDP
ncbi:MAG: UDP-N-acetylglucosamine 2-epimerase (hydrolyzing) [Planctomycetota bacterium]|nr:MAG: UDP-N-acetylglucosamine 2-epimerase (hydrolyzing) [Planctomycetota bacterium]